MELHDRLVSLGLDEGSAAYLPAEANDTEEVDQQHLLAPGRGWVLDLGLIEGLVTADDLGFNILLQVGKQRVS